MGNLTKRKNLLLAFSILLIALFAFIYTNKPSPTNLSNHTKVEFIAVGHGYGYRGRMSKNLYKPLAEALEKIEFGDLILFLGDNVEESKDEYYQTLFDDLDKIKNLKGNYYLSPGNHDIADKSGRETFLEMTDLDDTDYFFDRNGVRFISIDYSAYDKNTGKLENINGHNIIPEISKPRLKKLQKFLLKKNITKIDAIVIFTHSYVWDKSVSDKFVGIHDNTKFMETIFPMLQKTKKPVYVIAGNTCLIRDSKIENVRFLTTGLCSSADQTKGDNILKISITKDKSSSKINFNYQVIYLRDYYNYSNISLIYKDEEQITFDKINSNNIDEKSVIKAIGNLTSDEEILSVSYDENNLIYAFLQNQKNKSEVEILTIDGKLNKIINRYKYEFSDKGKIIDSVLIKKDNLITIEERNNFYQIRHIRLGQDKNITGIGILLLKNINFPEKKNFTDKIMFHDKIKNILYIKQPNNKYKIFQLDLS